MKTIATLLAVVGVASALAIDRNTTAVDYSNFTVAVVRAPSVNVPYPRASPPGDIEWHGQTYDLNRTIDLAIGYIHEAAIKGANFLAFPELWFPGYYRGPEEAGPSAGLSHYLDQGLVVNSTNWLKLLTAAADNKIWLEFGFAHRDGDRIYMGQAIVDSAGKAVQVRNKLRPSGGERSIFSDGTIHEFKVHQTPFGRMGTLECWEHMWPSMTIPMHAQVENIHIAAFPDAPDLAIDVGLESTHISLAASVLYAVTGNTWVLMPAVGTAAIIAPNGTIVVQIEASEDPLGTPMLYHSLNATAFAGTPDQQDGSFSRAALAQINRAYPAYVASEESRFIAHRENSVAQVKIEGPLPLDYQAM